jgi:hypothetical protein
MIYEERAEHHKYHIKGNINSEYDGQMDLSCDWLLETTLNT